MKLAVEQDDAILEAYLEGQGPNMRLSRNVFVKERWEQNLFPFLCGSAFKNKGVQPLLDAVVDYLPSPLDIGAVKGESLDGDAKRLYVILPMTNHFVGLLLRL